MNAYIVCGPASSGNRLVASILCRSGCAGSSSTVQPMTVEELPEVTYKNYVIIKHGFLPSWIHRLRQNGFEKIWCILPIRDPIATFESMRKRGYTNGQLITHDFKLNNPEELTFEEVHEYRNRLIARNITDAIFSRANVEVITYAGITESFLQKWLPLLELPYIFGDLNLPGQLLLQLLKIKTQNIMNATQTVEKLIASLQDDDKIDRDVYFAKFLIAKLLHPRTIIEIGVRTGYSAFCFCSAIPDVKYLGIDNNSNTHGGKVGSIYRAKVLLEGFDAEILIEDSQKLDVLPRRVDLIHVDGDHSYEGTLHDLKLSSQFTHSILVDDYLFIPEVKEATDKFIEDWNWIPTEIDHKQLLLSQPF